MKRIMFNVLCLAVVAMGSTQLSATEMIDDSFSIAPGESNYQTCMGQCERSGHGFTYCNGECKGLAS